jgi:predicted nucleic acid-binding protein
MNSSATIPRALVDTSVFIARERGQILDLQLGEVSISVVTVSELHQGVLLAPSEAQRARRLRTLLEVGRFPAVPIDRRVAITFAEMGVAMRQRGRPAGVLDTLIAATAAVLGVPLITRDTDFDHFPEIEVIRV